MSEQATMLTTAELAARLKTSDDTALRITSGVLHLGTGSRTQYRMPQATFNALVARKSATKKTGGGQ